MSNAEDIQIRLLKVASQLLAKTQEGVLHWTQTDARDQYLYSASSSGVLVDSYNDGTNFSMTILDSRGTTAEILDGLPHPSRSVEEDKEAYDVLSRLYDSARRYALGTDKVIDSLIQDVERGFNKPKPKGPFDDEPPF